VLNITIGGRPPAATAPGTAPAVVSPPGAVAPNAVAPNAVAGPTDPPTALQPAAPGGQLPADPPAVPAGPPAGQVGTP